jgi:8-oxo-dGTP pyrophosphatase MutT (NUDIX family)
MMCGIYRPRAGCVVYRTPHDSGSSSSSDEKGADTQLKAQGLEILLIESSKKEGQWTLPGGGIHYGESKYVFEIASRLRALRMCVSACV